MGDDQLIRHLRGFSSLGTYRFHSDSSAMRAGSMGAGTNR